jgi:hypothetical protein
MNPTDVENKRGVKEIKLKFVDSDDLSPVLEKVSNKIGVSSSSINSNEYQDFVSVYKVRFSS